MAKPSIAGNLMSLRSKGKLSKPSLQVHATMSTPYPGEGGGQKYEREEIKRLKKEIKAVKSQLDNWDDAEVAARVKKSLKADLLSKKARLAECKARLSEPSKDEEVDESY